MKTNQVNFDKFDNTPLSIEQKNDNDVYHFIKNGHLSKMDLASFDRIT